MFTPKHMVRSGIFNILSMSVAKEMRENLDAQVCELEALQSVYPKELTIADHGNLADINEYISGTRGDLPQRLEYSIDIVIPEGSIELQVNLPVDYPEVRPEVYARSCSLGRTQQTRLNEALMKFVDVHEIGEPCIYSLIDWIRDNLGIYLKESEKHAEKENSFKTKQVKEKDSAFARYWVYSHHICSNLKRKDIANEARDNCLSGFCLAGKPGIICVEGAMDDCDYWWKKIKVMNWHKILVKLVEVEELCDRNLESFRKFCGFQEISFPSFDKHNDMGQLLKYLTEHGSKHVFKDLFKVEGKTALPD